jgi:hypothetical protein
MLHGKTVAILSGGPSAIAHFARGQTFLGELETYETLIAVNHNAERVEADWWVFNDTPVFYSTSVKGRPVIFGRADWKASQFGTAAETWALWPRTFQEGCNDFMPRADPDSDVPIYTGPGYANWRSRPDGKANLPVWNRFSGLSALGLAMMLKPESVDLYGYDNTGREGVNDDAHPDVPRNREDYRWKMEVAVFGWFMEEFKKAGISVVRR